MKITSKSAFFSLPPKPTGSATNTGLNLLAIVPSVVLTHWAVTQRLSALHVAALAIATTFCCFLLLEVFVLKRLAHPESGLHSGSADWKPGRTATKLITLFGVFSLMALVYLVFPEYGRKLYAPFFELAKEYAWIPLLLVIPYVATTDAYLKNPYDVYWKIGRRILGHRVELSKFELKHFALGWAVKTFFLPLMFSFLVGHIKSLENIELQSQRGIEHILFGVDVMIGTVGYLMTLRPLGTHIRTADPSLIGWIVALSCYPPFNGVFMGSYFDYKGFLDPIDDVNISFSVELLLNLASLVSLFIYTLATVSFGVRFSNLTNRGIVTGGPYRYIKHPAYISKNAFWWIEVITHLPQNWIQSLKAIVLMAGVSGVYWMRAKTEERHLLNDQKYVEYSDWIAKNGLYARAIRLIK